MSDRQTKRVTKILCSEAWQQARLLQDSLKVWCHAVSKGESMSIRLLGRRLHEETLSAEVLWQRVRVSLGRPGKKQVNGRRDVVQLGDAPVPAGVLQVLEKGPKFASEVTVKPRDCSL